MVIHKKEIGEKITEIRLEFSQNDNLNGMVNIDILEDLLKDIEVIE